MVSVNNSLDELQRQLAAISVPAHEVYEPVKLTSRVDPTIDAIQTITAEWQQAEREILEERKDNITRISDLQEELREKVEELELTKARFTACVAELDLPLYACMEESGAILIRAAVETRVAEGITNAVVPVKEELRETKNELQLQTAANAQLTAEIRSVEKAAQQAEEQCRLIRARSLKKEKEQELLMALAAVEEASKTRRREARERHTMA